MARCHNIFLFLVLFCEIYGIWTNDLPTNSEDCENQIKTITDDKVTELFKNLNKEIDDITHNTVVNIVQKKIFDTQQKLLTERENLKNTHKKEYENLSDATELEIINETQKKMQKASDDIRSNMATFEAQTFEMVNKRIQDVLNYIRQITLNVTSEIDQTFQNHSKTQSQFSSETVAFTVKLTDNVMPNNEEYVVFDHVETNIGQGYNKTTGIFTAPKNGLFTFTSSFLVNNGYVNIQLIHNTVEIVRGYGASDAAEGSGFINVILNLTTGDTVGLKMISGWSTGELRGDLYSTFSGFQVGTSP